MPPKNDAPAFVDPWDLLVEACDLLRPPKAITVNECAVKHRRLENPLAYSGPWNPEIAPHIEAPMYALSDPQVRQVTVIGPSQAGKSELGLNWILHSILYAPADILIGHPDQTMGQDFSIKRIKKLVDLHPDVADRQLDETGSDNIFHKMFRGMHLNVVWPVGSAFRARPVPNGWLDDYDQFPEDIDGQGDAINLLHSRQTTFEGMEKTLVTSSPARDDGSGIEAEYNKGSRERFYWQCQHCKEYFSPEVDKHLGYKREGSSEEAALSAHLVCPECGAIIEPRDKRKMMATGIYLEPHQKIASDGAITGEPTGMPHRSFQFDGLFGFLSWGALAKELYEAEKAFDARQDEKPLKTFYQTRIGKNYRSRFAGEPAIAIATLVDRQEQDWKLGTIPEGVKVLTAAVDVQGNRFVVGVFGWGEYLECWVVDRFDLVLMEDGKTLIEPATHPEHWQIIVSKVIERQYELAGSPDTMVPILATAIDTGGEAGVSDNAVSFWYSLRDVDVSSNRVMLVKGGSNPNAVLLPPPSYLEQKIRGGPRKGGPRLWLPNVSRMKGTLDARLRRTEPGPGYIHLSADMALDVVEEFTAEENRNGKWVKLRRKNEMIDLYNYAYAVLLQPRMAGYQTNMDWVPPWAAVPDPDETITTDKLSPGQRLAQMVKNPRRE